MKERRNSERYEHQLNSNLVINDENHSSKLVNLSLGGIELSKPIDCNISVGDSCDVSLLAIDDLGDLIMKMEVCWVFKENIGLKYKQANIFEKTRLNKILSVLSKKYVLENSHFVM